MAIKIVLDWDEVMSTVLAGARQCNLIPEFWDEKKLVAKLAFDEGGEICGVELFEDNTPKTPAPSK